MGEIAVTEEARVKLQEALAGLGYFHQHRMMIGRMAELTKEIMKLELCGGHYCIDSIRAGIVDVRIMLEQLEMVYKPSSDIYKRQMDMIQQIVDRANAESKAI